MHNAKCRMQNYKISFGDDWKYVGKADTIILHYAFCILHS